MSESYAFSGMGATGEFTMPLHFVILTAEGADPFWIEQAAKLVAGMNMEAALDRFELSAKMGDN